MHLPRDYIMGPSAEYIPWLRTQQELSLIGSRTGFFTKLKPDPVKMFVEECREMLHMAKE